MVAISEAKIEEEKWSLISAAFTAYLLGGGDGKMTFNDYLVKLRLINPNGQNNQITAEEAIAKAERIREQVRKIKEARK